MSNYEKSSFEALEHDVSTLSSLVNEIKYLREENNITNQTPYSIFKQITPQEFQKTISSTFKNENRYNKIYQDYLLFPYDVIIFLILSIIGIVLLLKYIAKRKLIKEGIYFTKDDIVLQRRVTSKFVSFFIFLFVVFVVIVIKSWIDYLIIESTDTIYYKVLSVPLWLHYILIPFDLIIFMLIFVYTFVFIFKNYRAKLFFVDNRLYLHGSKIESYSKDEIESVSIEKYSPKLFNKIRGVALRFWKPLVKVVLEGGKTIYIRANNVNKLMQSIENWLKS